MSEGGTRGLGWDGAAPLVSDHIDTEHTDKRVHLVSCPYCFKDFDLFSASWCAHQLGEPSKVCPQCASCVCEHPAYAEPHFWKEAPPVFRRHGFERLFLFYL